MKKLLVILALACLPFASFAEGEVLVIVPGDYEFYTAPGGGFFVCKPPYQENVCIMIVVNTASSIITDGDGKEYEFKPDYTVTQDENGNPVYVFEDRD